MANLTLESRLVRQLGAPRPEPGHHVVVYKETGEGRIFHQTLARGVAFVPPLLDRWFGQFVGYAVRAGASLRYRFNEQLTTGVGERHDLFTLHVTLHYQVSEPEALVERLNDDPLGSLVSEIRDVFRRRASGLRYEELIDERLDIEDFLLMRGERGQRPRDSDSLQRFQSLAQDFGIELDRVEVTRSYSAKKIGEGIKITNVDYETSRKGEEVKAGHRVESIRVEGELELDQLRRQRKLLEAQTNRQIHVLDAVADGLQTVIGKVAGDMEGLPDLRRLVGELAYAREEVGRMLGPSASLEVPPGRAALGRGGGSPALTDELRRMDEIVGGLGIGPGERTGLMSRILHVLAEISMGEASEDGRLDGYIEDLHRYGGTIDLAERISSEEQISYFRRFRDSDTVRQALSDLSAQEAVWEEMVP